MPTYEYKCEKCGATHDEVRYVSDRDNDALCPVCSGTGRRVFSVPITTPTPWFKEGYDPGLGEYVHSKEQRKAIMDDKGVAEL